MSNNDNMITILNNVDCKIGKLDDKLELVRDKIISPKIPNRIDIIL